MKPAFTAKDIEVEVFTKTRDGRVLEFSQMKFKEACILYSLYMKHGFSGYPPSRLEVTFRPV